MQTPSVYDEGKRLIIPTLCNFFSPPTVVVIAYCNCHRECMLSCAVSGCLIFPSEEVLVTKDIYMSKKTRWFPCGSLIFRTSGSK